MIQNLIFFTLSFYLITQQQLKYNCLIQLISVLGCTAIFNLLFNCAKSIYILFLRKELNLLQRYGYNSWVVISGGANGIGLAYAKGFASRGFNIFILDFDQIQIPKAIEAIQQNNPNVQVKHFVVNFKQSFTDSQLFDKIINNIKDLDVSILVNNVGILEINEFAQIQEETLKDMISINIMPQILLTRKIIPMMRQRISNNRNLKCAILSTSSIRGNRSVQYHQVYGATKAFNDIFQRALNGEQNNNNIDFLVVKPTGIFTAQARKYTIYDPYKFNAKANIILIDSDEAVKQFFKDLGQSEESLGNYKQVLQLVMEKFIFGIVGQQLITKFYKNLIAQNNSAKSLLQNQITKQF